MRNPARIDRALAVLRELWIKNPDYRLMQLIGNAYDSGNDTYYIEDSDLLVALVAKYQPNNAVMKAAVVQFRDDQFISKTQTAPHS